MVCRKRKLSNANSRTVGLEYYEDFSGALDGREVPIDLIIQSNVNLYNADNEIIGSDQQYTVAKTIWGVEQSWSTVNNLVRKEGIRAFIPKVFAIKNDQGFLTIGDRVRIKTKEYTIWDQDRYDRENFTLYYLKEIALNENERPA